MSYQTDPRYSGLAALTMGAKLVVYGHSYTPVPGYYINPGHEWSTLIANQYMMSRNSKGVSGSRMIEVASMAIGNNVPAANGDRSYEPGEADVVVVEAEMNDAIFGPATTAGFQGYEHALRAFIATVSAAERREAETAARTGTWNTFSDGRCSGGSLLYANTYSAVLTFNNVSAPSGKVYLLTLANQAVKSPTGVIGIAVDGVNQNLDYVGSGQMEGEWDSKTSVLYKWPTYSPAVIAIDIPPTGTHTIQVVKMDNSNLPIYVDALLIPGKTPVPVLVCQDPPIGPYAVKDLRDSWAANSPTLHQIIANVVAEFPNAAVVDLGPGWDPDTMIGVGDANHFHPGDIGMDHIASLVGPEVADRLIKQAAKRIWALSQVGM